MDYLLSWEEIMDYMVHGAGERWEGLKVDYGFWRDGAELRRRES